MLLIVLILIAFDILQRVRDVAHAVEIGIVMVRVLGIVNRRVGRRVDNRQYQSAAVGTRTRGNGAFVVAVGVGYVAAYVQPLGDFRIKRGAEVVTCEFGCLNYPPLIRISARHIVVHFVGATIDGYLIVLGRTGLVGLIKPVGLVLQAIG